MRIQHNIAALNSYRQLGGNNNALSKNLEKLSSGYRINRAGDDAAGLAISEKMRAQIKGLETAQKNANDGISLVQTAEGALTEVHSMLNRMTELATQSANGTYDNDVDRANLQKEVEALKEEIDRISESTNFNGINLLDGTSLGSTAAVKVTQGGGTEAGDIDIAESATTGLTNFQPALRTPGVAESASKDFFTIGKLTATTDATGNTAGTTTFTLTFDDGATITAELKSAATGAGDANKVAEMTASELAAQIQAAVTTGATNANDFTGTIADNDGTLKIKMVAGNDMKTWADFKAGYSFTASDTNNELTVTAIKNGKKYGVTSAAASTTNVTADKVTTEVKDNVTGTLTTVNIGNRSQAAVNGTDKVDSVYNRASMEFTVTDNTVAASHGKVIELNGKKYVLKEKYTELSQDLKNATAGVGAPTVLEFMAKDSTDTSITNSADDERTVAGIIAKTLKNEITGGGYNGKIEVAADSSGSKIILEETMSQAASVLGGNGTNPASMTEDDFKALVNSATLTKNVGVTKADNQWLEVNNNIKNNSKVTINGKTYEFVTDEDSMSDKNAIAVKLERQTIAGKDVVNAEATAKNLLDALKANDAKFASAAIAVDPDNGNALKTTIDLGVSVDAEKVAVKNSASGLLLQVGDTSDAFNKVGVMVGDMSTKSLGIAGIDISTQEGASQAITKIKDAINQVSSTRGDLGAVQNRLEHTINNLGVTTENLTAAESRIRDTDMASEMMAYTKNNILIQASQAMLAQANQVPQGVLQLLQ